MKATIVDLRYRMKDVLKALDRREEVLVFYHGKIKGRLVPASNAMTSETRKDMHRHPFFGMSSQAPSSPLEELDRLRTSRLNDL